MIVIRTPYRLEIRLQDGLWSSSLSVRHAIFLPPGLRRIPGAQDIDLGVICFARLFGNMKLLG